MSSTRHASKPGPMRQERFSSSPEFERGLLGNLVAQRCGLLDSVEERELVWFVQHLSHQEGGLKRMAKELRTRWPERMATPTMQRLGCRPGQNYNAEQVRSVRSELVVAIDAFPLKGEKSYWEDFGNDWAEGAKRLRLEAQVHPSSYPASDFAEHCQQAADQYLENALKTLCLDPASPLEDGQTWYFPALISTLRECAAEWAKERAPRFITSIGQRVTDALDFALEERCTVLIDGLARTGKSFEARRWCEQRPGLARYVQVPSSNDEMGFFRAIAISLGVSTRLKAQEIRLRVEETLQSGGLMLVMDEAHHLFPVRNHRAAKPWRINWLMTALANHGVPVAMVTTPQYFAAQHSVETNTGWTSEQLTGRIGHYERLYELDAEGNPVAPLTLDDLRGVALSLVPHATPPMLDILAHAARVSPKYLAAIENTFRRAHYLARKRGSDSLTQADLKAALQEAVMPSERALAQAVSQAESRRPNRRGKAVAMPVQTSFSRAARPEKPFAERQTAPAEMTVD